MKVLVIGGSGYVGSYTSWLLKSRNLEVTIYDTKFQRGLDVNFIQGDLSETDFLQSAAKDFDTILIMAGLVGDPACEANPDLADELNHKAVARICERMEDKHIIFMSTCAVYGNKGKQERLHENIPAAPLSVYARTKLDGERHVMSAGGLVMRLGSVYGGIWKDNIRMDSIVNILVQKAVYEHSITILGGSQWKSLISIRDVAELIYEAVARGITGLYNVSSRNYTLTEIGQHVINCIPGTSIIHGVEPPDDRNYRIDNSKRLQAFRYDAMYGIDEEIFRLKDLFTK